MADKNKTGNRDKAGRDKRDQDKPVFLYIGIYDDPLIAGSDLEIVRELYDDGVIATYDAAITTKELDGSVTVGKVEKPTQHGAWTGAAVGAVVGILFPPFLIASAAVGALVGGLIGHFWRGMSRKDIHDFGELLDDGQAALIVLGEDTLLAHMEKANLRPKKRIERRLAVDGVELHRELIEAERELAA